MRLFETLKKKLKKWKPINFEIMTIKSYIETNENRFLDELFSLIRIPSVSAQQEHKPDMEACARRWVEILLSSGVDKAEVMPTEGNPIVYAEKMVNPEADRVGLFTL